MPDEMDRNEMAKRGQMGMYWKFIDKIREKSVDYNTYDPLLLNSSLEFFTIFYL